MVLLLRDLRVDHPPQRRVQHRESVFYFVLLFASSMFYPVEPLPTPLRQLSWANPITWHVDVLRYATIGIGEPALVAVEAAAFLLFTGVAFGGALLALKRQ